MSHHKPEQVPKPAHQTNPSYDSNPFTLSFRAMSKLFTTNANWAIAVVIFAFLSAVGQAVSELGRLLGESSQSSSSMTSAELGSSVDPTIVIAIVIVVLVIVLVAVIFGTAFGVLVQGMFAYVALESEKDRKVSFNEAFQAVIKRFWRLFFAQLLASLKIFGWTLLLIVPGIIAALRYNLLAYVIMSEPENQGAIKESHDRVKTVTKGRLMEVFGVGTVSAIVPFIGSLLAICGGAALYRQLEHYTDKNIQKPSVHWLNYLGLVLIALFIGFLFLILGLVIFIAAASK